jgi:hypothetical protein
MDELGFLQWPAMVVSVVAAWLVGSQAKNRRLAGFWWFMGSNVLWIAWGWHTRAWALIVLQVALAFLNIRGAKKNADATRKN